MKHKSLLIILLVYIELFSFSYEKTFKSQMKRYDADMVMRRKIKQGMSHHVKKINQLYKEELINLLMNRQYHYGVTRSHFFSYLQMTRAPNDKENLQHFFADQKNFTIETRLDKLAKNATTEIEPWSSTWWPIANGQTSVRYNKDARMNSVGDYDKTTQDYKKKYSYVESVESYSQPNDFYAIYHQDIEKYQSEINEVWSPAEKYDLLVGDYNFTFTKAEKAHGLKYTENYGNVPAWFGYCHGWTPASYLFKRPSKTVTIVAADGITKINFLPDDIKGLASAFVANSAYFTNFFGSACNYRKNPISTDNETGLYNDKECNDIEPGSTIQILGNLIGRLRKNLAFDPDPDFEIWNQPIRGYKLQYFNLMTNKTAEKVNDAKILYEKLDIKSPDRFLNFLHKSSPVNTHSFIGVFLTIEYVVETELLHQDNMTNPDSIKTVDYVGGVNLDVENNILGGEWRYNHHPDFMWRISDVKEPQSPQDAFVKVFNGSPSELKIINQYAIKASQAKIPIKKIIEYLAEKSYVKPEKLPIVPSIIPVNAYRSIGNGYPIKVWPNGICSVRSEDNYIIFTGSSEITRIEPTDSYYKYTDPANGVAYYSANPFVFRMKKYETKDDNIMPENMNKGNSPQIGSKSLVYCEDDYRYSFKGNATISFQSPTKGNFFNFITRKGKTFFSLKPFSVSYGEMPNCDPNDETQNPTPPAPSTNDTTPANATDIIDDDVSDDIDSKRNGNDGKNNDVHMDDDEDGLDDILNDAIDDITDDEDINDLLDINLFNGNNRNNNDDSKEVYSREGLLYVVKMRINGIVYSLKGDKVIQRTKPVGGYYFQTLPNGISFYSLGKFKMSYDTAQGTLSNESRDNNNNNNNNNNNRNNNNRNNRHNNHNRNNNHNNWSNDNNNNRNNNNNRDPIRDSITVINNRDNTRNNNNIPNPITSNTNPYITPTSPRNTNTNNYINTLYGNNRNPLSVSIGTNNPYTYSPTRGNNVVTTTRGGYINPYLTSLDQYNNPTTTNYYYDTNYPANNYNYANYNTNSNNYYGTTNANGGSYLRGVTASTTNARNGNSYVLGTPYSVSRYVNGHLYTISGSSPITTTQPAGPFHFYDFPDGSRYYSASAFQVTIQ